MSDSEVKEKKIKLLCVDDEKNILVSLKRLFRKSGYEIFLAESGEEGLQVLREQKVDIIISDMRMPHMDGAEFLSLAKDIRKNVPSILLTGFSDQESTIRAINEGKISGYVSKPWEDNDLKLKVTSLLKISHLEREKERLLLLTHKQNKQLRDWNKQLEQKVTDRVNELKQAEGMLDKAYEELQESYEAVIKLLSHAICTKEHMLTRDYPELPGMARSLAEKAGLNEYLVKQVYYSGLLFELGKLALPESLLETPIELLDVEGLEKLMTYPEIGATVLADIANFTDTARIIEHHYEYLDGSGAPDALAMEEIPIGCKVLGIVKDYYLLQAGKFDGIQHKPEQAREYLQAHKEKLYDPELVNLFMDLAKSNESETKELDELKLTTMTLQPGMILSRNCSNGQGLLLINKGKALTEESIKRLIAFEKVYDIPLDIYVRN